MHAASLIAAYAAVVLAPLALAWAQGRPPRPFWDEIASGLGMAAFAILLVEFVLSGRYRGVSGRIGMDVTMRFHQLVARTALAFVLLHPFLYATPFGAPLPWDPTGQATLGLGIATLATGMAAWVALPAFVLLSIFRDQLPYRYETWRWLHLLGAVLIALMVTHHALEAGRYAADPLLAGFWLLLLAAAIGSLAYARIVAPFRRAARPYRVASVRRLASRTWELTVEPTRGAALEFRAGQFVWLKIGHGPLSLAENPFSISSAPAHRPAVQFVIKEAGDLTDRIGAVPVGTPVHLDGPHGNLTLDGRSGAGIALIAGGVEQPRWCSGRPTSLWWWRSSPSRCADRPPRAPVYQDGVPSVAETWAATTFQPTSGKLTKVWLCRPILSLPWTWNSRFTVAKRRPRVRISSRRRSPLKRVPGLRFTRWRWIASKP